VFQTFNSCTSQGSAQCRTDAEIFYFVPFDFFLRLLNNFFYFIIIFFFF